MFRWCAYCARFLGERAPWQDFSPTHGICTRCEGGDAMSEREAIARVQPILDFHAGLRERATRLSDEELPSPEAVLTRGRELGIRPLDLLVGVLQPILYEMGRLWAAGALSPATEARFTAFTGQVLDMLFLEQARERRPRTGRPIFLKSAPSNRHTVGIRMLGFAMREAGHDARVITDPIELDWLIRLVTLLRPTMVGISIAHAEEVQYAIRVLERIEAIGLDVRVVVGGSGLAGVDAVTLPDGLGRMGDAGLDLLRAS